MTASEVVTRAWREMTEPERAAWARMQARHCGVMLRRKQKFLLVLRTGDERGRNGEGDNRDDQAD